ncbi:polypyrimidine tract-binding protein [Achlya hypogyna]|uniref:Polypyrimidine tract-binding protein n=1 Tax=Achlya hypogyna TaxID=1202772 RepID=A0A1V9Z6A7_ACHHY|nr:polypyrimidine tract-binding protein [Achlya hypogyna]
MDDHFMKVGSLFTFFGCFGDVMRIKIMYRKQGTALVQFLDESHATSARENLNGVLLCGKKLRVDYSKHMAVVMPRADGADSFEKENTIDYSNAQSHRYKRRMLAEVAPPSPLLHVSGLPAALQPAVPGAPHPAAELFGQHGLVRHCHEIPSQPSMVLIEMASLEDAVDALVALDNSLYVDGRLRVSFSKSAPRA